MTQRYIDLAFDDTSPRSFGGFDNENEATVIRLKVLDPDAKYYIEIEQACGKHDKYCSDVLPVDDGYAVFEVSRDFTHETLYVQGVMKVNGMCRKTARVRVGFSHSINALDELPESQPSWADSVDERIDSLEMVMKETLTYTPQTLTEAQKSQARTNIGAEKAGTGYTKPDGGIPKSDLAEDVQTSLAKADTAISYDSQTLTEEQTSQARQNIGALPERAIENFWSKDHSTRDIRDMLVEYRYGVISHRGDDCNINGVIINREIMFPCMVLSLQYYTDQIRNLVILDGAGRTLDITVHSNSGVLAYRWHQPILRTWTDEQEPI